MSLFSRLERRAHRLKADLYALYLAARDPRTPWYAKLFLAGVVAYAASPIDLIPDFVPVLGYLDDVILIPFALALALKLVPYAVMADCRARAAAATGSRQLASRTAAVATLTIWVLAAVIGGGWAYSAWRS